MSDLTGVFPSLCIGSGITSRVVLVDRGGFSRLGRLQGFEVDNIRGPDLVSVNADGASFTPSLRRCRLQVALPISGHPRREATPLAVQEPGAPQVLPVLLVRSELERSGSTVLTLESTGPPMTLGEWVIAPAPVVEHADLLGSIRRHQAEALLGRFDPQSLTRQVEAMRRTANQVAAALTRARGATTQTPGATAPVSKEENDVTAWNDEDHARLARLAAQGARVRSSDTGYTMKATRYYRDPMLEVEDELTGERQLVRASSVSTLSADEREHYWLTLRKDRAELAETQARKAVVRLADVLNATHEDLALDELDAETKRAIVEAVGYLREDRDALTRTTQDKSGTEQQGAQ